MATKTPQLPDWHVRTRLKVRQLALLVAIDEHRSLRRAAVDIAVTQPAATRMLADLEEALGVPLFDRAAWGMQATPYGEAMIRRARSVLTDLAEAREEGGALAAGAKGTLRVGSETGAVPRLLAPALQQVRRDRPGLRTFVLVNTSDVLVAALAQGTLDLAIGHLPTRADAGDYDVLPLRHETLCVVARAGHPLAKAKSLAPATLSAMPWILHPPDTGMRAEARALLSRAGVRAPVDLVETVSIVATLALLETSDAVSVLPAALADHYAAQGLLVRLAVDLPPGGGTVTELITRRNRRLAPAAQELVSALQRSAAARVTAAPPPRSRRA
ncbi:MAG: LysR family transcriptional regulator [Betaproteobacteria bacterium]